LKNVALLSDYFSISLQQMWGQPVTQFVEALSYKPEDRSSIPDGVIEIFIDIILPAAL
jgi:hypothetical protein